MAADGCAPSGTFTGNGNAANQQKRLVGSPLFSCAADSGVSISAILRTKLEVEHGLKPVSLPCGTGHRAYRIGAKQWECLQIDNLDSCQDCELMNRIRRSVWPVLMGTYLRPQALALPQHKIALRFPRYPLFNPSTAIVKVSRSGAVLLI